MFWIIWIDIDFPIWWPHWMGFQFTVFYPPGNVQPFTSNVGKRQKLERCFVLGISRFSPPIPVVIVSRHYWVDEGEEDCHSWNKNLGHSSEPTLLWQFLGLGSPSIWFLLWCWVTLGLVAFCHIFHFCSLNFPNYFNDENNEGDDNAGNQPDVDEFEISWQGKMLRYL